jgi:hypothetical protein
VTYSGSTYLANVANGPNRLTPDANTSAWVVVAQQGATGSAGSQGLTGALGTQGSQGIQGFTGAIGPQGAQGPKGDIGAQGSTGAQGTAGTNGTNGTNGIDGINGAQGIQGISGTNGTNGTNGTGFNFRGTFDPNISYAVNDVVTFTPTSITYNVNLSFGASGSMVGTITTDGTQGVLSVGNIVGWSLTLTDHGTNSTILTPGNSAFSSGNYNTGGQPNSDFSATPTNLTFTYANGGSWGVSGASGQFCMTDWSNCFGPVAFGTWSINGDNQWTYSGASGTQIVGTGGTAATHGTSTYVATAPVTAGTAIPGTLPWTMMAQAGAPGAAGLIGPQGLPGFPGVQGFTGPAGADSTVPGPQGPTGPQGPAGPSGPGAGNYILGANGLIVHNGATITGIANQIESAGVDVQFIVPSTQTFTHFVCKSTGGYGDNIIFTILVNGGGVAVCSPAWASGGFSSLFSDRAITLTLNIGDLVDVEVDNAMGDRQVWWSLGQ